MTGGAAVVERTGPLCTIQDLGRRTGRRLGIAPGGAMDQRACLWANRLLDNDPMAAVLEVSLGGARIGFMHGALVALTGADCGASVDGSPVGPWRSFRVHAGQSLTLAFSASGMRAYVAFPGGLEVPTAFGSASVVLREGLAGRLGRPLERGEAIRWKGLEGGAVRVRSVPEDHIPAALNVLELPLTRGYEWDRFSAQDQARVFSSVWTVDPAGDRVACRLAGPKLESGPRILDSVPLVDGTVQVPGDGRPLVFMRDRPTIGGYAKLGSVDPISLDRLAQARPGTRVRFVAATERDGLVRIRRREDFFGIMPGPRSGRAAGPTEETP